MPRGAAADPEGFVRAWTRVDAPPLTPEIRLHLAGPVTPLWEATERILAETGLPPPYWAFAWPGGQALARHVLDRPALVAGRRVLDFAAGSALAGIAAAKAGAAGVVASDLDPLALAAIRLNAALNGVAVAAAAADLTDTVPAAEVVLAGDVCYERPMAERVWPWLRRCAAAGLLVLLADPGRAYLPRQGLVEQARYRVPTSRELEDREERETVVYRVAA
jgi:predicted nicotinamide N-methyase